MRALCSLEDLEDSESALFVSQFGFTGHKEPEAKVKMKERKMAQWSM